MKRWLKIIKRLIFITAVLFIFSIIFSLLFPGKVPIVDSIRMFAQKPALKWAGKIKFEDITFKSSQEDPEIDISMNELKKFIKELSPGSIFFTKTRNYPLTEFVPGEWIHTGIYLGTKQQFKKHFRDTPELIDRFNILMNNSDIYVLDSYSEGVSIHPIKDLSNLSDKSYLIKFAAFSFNLPVEQKVIFINEAFKYLGREYDYDWITDDPGTIFCSELLYHSLKSLSIEIDSRTRTVSRDIFTPDDLYRYLTTNSGENKKFSFYGILSKTNAGITIP